MKYFNFWTSGFCAYSAMVSFMNHNILMGIGMVLLSLTNILIGVINE